ncbi:hypothetical protein QNK12_07335 [Neobacillus cucumis]|nr:hypothetical protein QNK12_07335 [Neobacillus cucumis]
MFLENGLEGTNGYFLYKSIDGNNVLKKLHKKGEVGNFQRTSSIGNTIAR